MTTKTAYTTTEVKRFMTNMRQAKAAERGDVQVFEDNLMRVTVAVQVGKVAGKGSHEEKELT